MGTSTKTAFSVGLLLLLTGCVIVVATWPHSQTDPLEGTLYGSHVRADAGLAAALLGLLLVLLASIACGMRRLDSINQENKP